MYWLRVPKIIRRWQPEGIWEMSPGVQLSVFLTFDDGPHPEATPFVLDLLAKNKAKATFFCVGKNVQEHPDIYARILQEGHRTGNHTFNHVNGWKARPKHYLDNVIQAKRCVESELFRPPYGRIKRKEGRLLREAGFKIVYWSLLSGDFDKELSPQKCLNNVLANLQPGDIVVFHDSAKAFSKLQFVLPKVVEFCCKNNWQMKSL